MKKLIILAAAATMMFGAVSAQAADDMKGGLGFHVGGSPFGTILTFVTPGTQAAPTLGGRQWFTSNIGVDLGVGFNSFKAEQGTQTETWTGIGFDIGLPIVVKKFDRVNFIFRPGFQYGTLEDKDESVIPTVTTKFTMTGFSGELEAEWMVADNVSISAAHGIAYNTMKDDGTPEIKFTSIGTTGSNFTQLGFTIYLW